MKQNRPKLGTYNEVNMHQLNKMMYEIMPFEQSFGFSFIGIVKTTMDMT